MSNKKVSIIVANYNNGPYLSTFLDSILQSSLLPYECIIVDDGSTDNSLQVLDQYRDISFLKVIRFPKNLGFTAALNMALEEASGDYIMRSDPDDVLTTDRICVQLQWMERHPDVDVLGSNAEYFLDTLPQRVNKTNFPESHDAIYNMFRKGENAVLHATAFVKASVYKQYRYQSIFPGEDYELFARMIRDGYRFHNLQDSLYYVRIHSGSSTSLLKKSQVENLFMFRDIIFKTKSTQFEIWSYFLHLRFYRLFHLSKSPVKYIWLFLSAILYPSKVVKRIIPF